MKCKKLISLVLSLAMTAGMAVPVMAAGTDKPDGSAGSPFTAVPNCAIDETTGVVTGVTQTRGTSSLTLTDLETKKGEDGKWFLSNPLGKPIKGSVMANLTVLSPTDGDIMVDGDNKGKHTGHATDTTDVEVSIPAGKEVLISLSNKTPADSVYWRITLPNNEKEAPVLEVQADNGELKDVEGVITSNNGNTTSRTLDFKLKDTTGFTGFTFFEYADDTFGAVHANGAKIAYNMNVSKPVTVGGVEYTPNAFPLTSTAEFTVDENSKYTKEYRTSITVNNKNSYFQLVATDVFGNISTFKILVLGMTGVSDTAGPTITIVKDTPVYDNTGAVKEVTGKIVIADDPAGLKSAKVSKGTEVMFENANMGGQAVNETVFKVVKTDKSKVLTADAADTNANKSSQTFDLATDFGETPVDPDEPGGGEKPDPPTEKPAPVISTQNITTVKDSAGKVTEVKGEVLVTSENGLTSATVTLNGQQVLGTGSETSEVYAFISKVGDSGKVIAVSATDKKGKVTNKSFDLASYYATVTPPPSTITSTRELKKVITGPVFKYEDDATLVDFTAKPGSLAGFEWEWILKRGSKEIEAQNNGESFLFEFDKAVDKAGDYIMNLVLTKAGEKKDIELKIPFTLEYRDGSDMANALKQVIEKVEGGYEITLSLDKDLLSEARKTVWTLPDGKQDNGYSIVYKVKDPGVYKFKLENDGEIYKHTTTVVATTTGDEETKPGEETKPETKPGEETKPDGSGNKEYTGANAPVPGKGLVNSITKDTQKITIPMSNWDKKEWKILASSLPSTISYSEDGNSIIFTVPNKAAKVSFKMLNSKSEFVTYNFPVSSLNADGSDKTGNVQTGGLGGNSGSTGGTSNGSTGGAATNGIPLTDRVKFMDGKGADLNAKLDDDDL